MLDNQLFHHVDFHDGRYFLNDLVGICMFHWDLITWQPAVAREQLSQSCYSPDAFRCLVVTWALSYCLLIEYQQYIIASISALTVA